MTTAGGTSGTGRADRFKFVPTISNVSPSQGSTAGGETVTITGTGFVSAATTVKFGRVKARSVNCTSWDVANPAVETTCTVTSPAHMAATVNVRATVNKTTSPNTAADQYTYG